MIDIKGLLNKISVDHKRQIAFLLFFVLTISVMVTGFVLSAQTADQSGALSDSFREEHKPTLESALNTIDRLEEEQKLDIVTWISNYLRKLAHMLLYSVMGFCLLGATINFDPIKKWWLKPIFALAIGGVYGIFDEIHQYFVPGRSCEVNDILIDFASVFLGICIMLMSYGLFRLFLLIWRKMFFKSKN